MPRPYCITCGKTVSRLHNSLLRNRGHEVLETFGREELKRRLTSVECQTGLHNSCIRASCHCDCHEVRK